MPKLKKNSTAAITPMPPSATKPGIWTTPCAAAWTRRSARRPRFDLPQVYLGCLRGAAREAGGRARAGRGPRGSRRVSGVQQLLDAARGALGISQGRGEAAYGRPVYDAMTGIERDNPALKGVLPQGLRPPRARQAAARPACRSRWQYPGRRRGEPFEGRAGACLRVLPVAVCER